MTIHVARTGLCWGIELAYARIDKLAAQEDAVAVTHRTAADPNMSRWDPVQRITADNEKLFERYPNLRTVSVLKDVESAPGNAKLAIGHQGLYQDEIAVRQVEGREIFDYKCPFIAKFDEWADRLAGEGYDLIAFGKPKNHHSIYAMAAAERNNKIGLVAESVDDIRDQLGEEGRNWACIGQVTGNTANWEKFKSDLAATGVSVRIRNTVCTDSYERQDEAVELARTCDVVMVVDDRGGATTSVYEQCVAANNRSFRFDPDSELPTERFDNAETVAIVGGILVPKWTLREVAERVRSVTGGDIVVR